MVEVDINVLVATGVIASVAIAAIAGCANPNKQQEKSSQKKQQKKKPEVKKESVAATKSAAPVKAKPTAKAKAVDPTPAPVMTSAAAPVPVVEAAASEKKGKKAKETPEQRAARLERQKLAKQKKNELVVEPAAVESEVANIVSPSPASAAPAAAADGWEVVADKRSKKAKKPKKVEAPAPVDSDSGAPVAIDQTTGTLKVEPKKVGILIGPKGATMHAIQDATETKITMPKTDRDATAEATVSVVGAAEGVAKAISIMKELCNKGYAVALEGENFQESSISVHHKYELHCPTNQSYLVSLFYFQVSS